MGLVGICNGWRITKEGESMSLSDPRWVDVDVEGEYTGTKYHGRFQLKPFLMVSEKTEVVLLAQKLKK